MKNSRVMLYAAVLFSAVCFNANAGLMASFTQANGVVTSTENIPVEVTLTTDVDFSFENDPSDINSALSNLVNLGYDIPTFGRYFNTETGSNESIEIENINRIFLSRFYTCTGTTFTDGTCASSETTYDIDFGVNSLLTDTNLFTLNVGESISFIMAELIPNGGIAAPGNYTLSGVGISAVFLIEGFDSNNVLQEGFARIRLAATQDCGQPDCSFNRTVVNQVSAPMLGVMTTLLVGLTLVRSRLTK